MFARKQSSNLLERFQSQTAFTANGIKAEAVGRHSIRISRHGRFIGLWREVLGSYEWCPAGEAGPKFRVGTTDEALRIFNRDLANDA